MPAGTALYEGSFRTADITAPTISGVSVSNITDTSARFQWTTSEAADGLVEIGLNTLYGQETELVTALTTAHDITIDGLTENTGYFYRLTSNDAAGNPVVATGTFSTIDSSFPSLISFTAVETKSATGLAGSEITVDAIVNEITNFRVEYATNINFTASTLTSIINNSPKQLVHHQVIAGLTAEQTYYLRAIFVDAGGNSTTGSAIIVNTVWTPVLLGADLVHWFEMRRETALVNGAGIQTPTDWSGAHTGALRQPTGASQPTYLDAANGPHGKAAAQHINGTNWITASDVDDWDFASASGFMQFQVFQVANPAANDTYMAKYDTTTNVIHWSLKTRTDGQLSLYTDGKGTEQVTTLPSTMADSGIHAVMIRNDGAGNETVSRNGVNNINAFTGMTVSASTGNTRIGNGPVGTVNFDGYTFISIWTKANISDANRQKLWAYVMPSLVTSPDVTAPIITNVIPTEIKTADGITGSTVRLTWVSDEVSTSRVEYADNPSFIGSITTTEIDTTTPVLNHVVDIPGLTADKAYWFKVKSKDAFTNDGEGAVVSLITAWTPILLGANLQVWIDATRAKVAGQAEGSTTAPLDYSGKGFTITPVGSPVFHLHDANGSPCWTTDGVSQYFEITGTSGLNLDVDSFVMLIYRAATPGATRQIMGRHAATTPFARSWGIDLLNTGQASLVTTGGGTDNSTATEYSGGVPVRNRVLSINRIGGNAQLYHLDVAQDLFTGVTNTTNNGKLRIFANGDATQFLAADLIGVVICNRALEYHEFAALCRYQA